MVLRSLLASLVVLGAACSNTTSGPTPDGHTSKPTVGAPALEGRTFLSRSVTEGGTPRALVGTEVLQLQFHGDARISASAGCNTFSAAYTLDGGRLVVSEGGQTEMGCDPPRHEQDDWYFGLLQSSLSLTHEGDQLVLDGKDTRIEYLDREVATPDLPLVGQQWTVDTLIEGEAASGAAWPSPATLSFTAEGRVELRTGCNQGAGAYATEGDRITFSEVEVTEADCADELSKELEQAVLAVLNGPQPVTWKIDAERLTLEGKGAGLGLVAAKD